MNLRLPVARATLAVIAALSMFACGERTEAPAGTPSDLNAKAEEIIGGFDAPGGSLNAIGTLGMKNKSGAYQFFCSATLIGPQTVLTAKHCAIELDGPLKGMKLVNLTRVYFAVGPDSLHPTQLVEAIAADISPLSQGGMVELGNDVSVYHLISPVVGVTPFKVASTFLTPDEIGRRYVSIGFGAQDNLEDITGNLKATRKMGTGTLAALEGKAFELMLGNFQVFVDQFIEEYGKDVVDANMDLIQSWWDNTVIYKGYESWVGHQLGDSQTCHGDSGGPLVGRVSVDAAGNTERQIFGVVSGGWHSSQLKCDYGTFYASIGPVTQDFIAQAKTYQDPCAGTDALGACDGTTATRCSDKWEGDRRLLVVDCAELDQVCGKNLKGQAACLDPNEIPVDGGSAPDAGTATDGGSPTVQNEPTLEEVRQLVNRTSRGYMLPLVQKLEADKNK